jgi:hypothetical protein
VSEYFLDVCETINAFSYPATEIDLWLKADNFKSALNILLCGVWEKSKAWWLR